MAEKRKKTRNMDINEDLARMADFIKVTRHRGKKRIPEIIEEAAHTNLLKWFDQAKAANEKGKS